MKSRGPTSSNRHKVVCINWWSGSDLRTIEKGSPIITMRLGFPAKELKDTEPTRWKEGVSPVQCVRCGGLLVAEPCTDFWDDAGNLAVRRCVQCGELVDQVILQNRQRRPTGELPTSRRSSVISRSENRI